MRATYDKLVAPPPQVSNPSLSLSRKLLLITLDGDMGVTMQVREAAAAGEQALPPDCPCPSPPVSLEYTSSQLESARSNLEAVSKQVREYIVSLGEWGGLRQPFLTK